MSRLALVPAALLALSLAGCGTPSQPLPMVITPAEALQMRGWVPDALRAQVGVAPVRGGADTGRWWGSLVTAGVLQHALEESLHAIGMRAPAPEPTARFELQAHLVLLEQPRVPAAGVTVGVAVNYVLTDKASGRVVYQRRLYNQEEAGLGDAVVSPSERLRIANERALRANIGLLLRDLVTLRP
jgi:hypothetical protein